MKMNLPYVSISVAGDEYYQVLFEEKKDEGREVIDVGNLDLDTPYFMIQRQFEMPDGGECYVETNNPEYCGHYRIVRAKLGSNRIFLQIDREKSAEVEVIFSASERDYRELKRVMKIMIPHVEFVSEREC